MMTPCLLRHEQVQVLRGLLNETELCVHVCGEEKEILVVMDLLSRIINWRYMRKWTTLLFFFSLSLLLYDCNTRTVSSGLGK